MRITPIHEAGSPPHTLQAEKQLAVQIQTWREESSTGILQTREELETQMTAAAREQTQEARRDPNTPWLPPRTTPQCLIPTPRLLDGPPRPQG